MGSKPLTRHLSKPREITCKLKCKPSPKQQTARHHTASLASTQLRCTNLRQTQQKLSRNWGTPIATIVIQCHRGDYFPLRSLELPRHKHGASSSSPSKVSDSRQMRQLLSLSLCKCMQMSENKRQSHMFLLLTAYGMQVG